MSGGRRAHAVKATVATAAQAAACRPRHLALAGVVAGLLAAPVAREAAFAAIAGALGAGVVLRRPDLGLIVAAAVLAGAVGASARLAALDRTALAPALGHATSATITLLTPPRSRPFGGWSARARLETDPGRGERVVLRAPARVGRTASVGSELRVRGRLVPLGSWEGFERINGAHAAIVVAVAVATGRRRAGPAGIVDRVRERAELGLSAGMEPPQAALARGMVLGQDEALEDLTRQDFRASGLAHLLAASGQNVTLVALLAVAALRAIGLGLRGRLGGALALVALYVPIAGAGASIQRAGIMGAAGLVAGLAGRPGSRAYALLFAATATLALNPRAPHDVGWQLSFAAVVAIALLAGRWADALARRHVPGPLAEAAGLTAAATAGTAPLLAAHFGTVSLVSLPANLVAAPAVAPVVWLGTASAVLGQIPGGQVVAPVINPVTALPLGFVGWVAHTAAGAPGAAVAVVLGGPVAVVAVYAALAMAITFRPVRRVAGIVAAALAAVVGWAHAHPPGPPRSLAVSFLDVGQGDATLVQHGPAAILVDTGPPGGPILARLRRAGVRRLSLLVLTHAQADHEGAASAILAGLPVDAVLDGGDGVRSPERTAIEAAEAAHRVRRILPAAGETLAAGPLRIQVLWPRPEPASAHAGADPNARAIVARVSDGGHSVLLTADAESDVTLPLAPAPVELLKVAHHGSADPGLGRLVARLRPTLAAIEVGRHNTYGHPTAQAIAALRVVPRIVRTDRDGTVRVTFDDRGLVVRTHA